MGRFTLLALLALMIVAGLAGCGPKEDETPPAGQVLTTDGKPVPPEAKNAPAAAGGFGGIPGGQAGPKKKAAGG